MKFFCALFSLAVMTQQHGAQAGWKRLGDSRHLGDEFRTFSSDDAETDDNCLGIKDSKVKNGQKLVLGKGCTRWRVDEDGLFHSELNENYCMQAGHGAPPKSGTKMRLYECNNKRPLQKFDYSDGIVIKLQDTKYCVAFQGQTGTKGDELILKDCNKSDGQDNWSTD